MVINCMISYFSGRIDKFAFAEEVKFILLVCVDFSYRLISDDTQNISFWL